MVRLTFRLVRENRRKKALMILKYRKTGQRKMLTRTLWLSQVMNVVSLFFSASILLVFASSKTLETV